MKRIIRAIKTAFVVGYIDFKKPSFMTESTLKTLLDLFTFLMKVAEEKKPYMTSIMINIEKPVELVSLWAGAGAGAEPIKRIKELVEEVDLLKYKLVMKSGVDTSQLNKILYDLEYSAYNLIGQKYTDLPKGVVESTSSKDSLLIAIRDLKKIVEDLR